MRLRTPEWWYPRWAIFILTLAWTLSGICSEDYMNLRGFVASIVNAESALSLLMPAIFFLIALGLAFATGTTIVQ